MQKLGRFAGFDNELILVEALRNGHELAVEYWFSHYYHQLKKNALNKLPSEEVAEEVVQETFIACLQSLNLFNQQANLLTWMQSILRHEIADFYRKCYAKKFIQTLPLSEFFLDTKYSGVEETAEKVKIVLKQMLGSNKELLLKKYIDKKPVKEIATEKGKTAKAIESELFRARNEFRDLWLALETAKTTEVAKF